MYVCIPAGTGTALSLARVVDVAWTSYQGTHTTKNTIGLRCGTVVVLWWLVAFRLEFRSNTVNMARCD